MSATQPLLPAVVCLQIDQRLRDAEEDRLRRLARRAAARRPWPRSPRPR